MDELYSFYDSILNIDNVDKKDIIISIVNKEKEKLLQNSNSVDGFCKYIANQITYEIKYSLPGIHVFYVDLKELVSVDHVVLIVEYRVNDEVKRLLVDPTFVQFIDDNNKPSDLKLYADKNWEDNILVLDLLTYGVYEIDSVGFNKYLNYFSYGQQYFELEEYLFQKRINSNSSISFNEKGLS